MIYQGVLFDGVRWLLQLCFYSELVELIQGVAPERMRPDVCRFISKAIYEDRLESFADCANQGIEAAGRLTGTGIRYVPTTHEGNTRESPEEAEAIAGLIDDLLKGQYFQTHGTSDPLDDKRPALLPAREPSGLA